MAILTSRSVDAFHAGGRFGCPSLLSSDGVGSYDKVWSSCLPSLLASCSSSSLAVGCLDGDRLRWHESRKTSNGVSVDGALLSSRLLGALSS